MQEEIELIKQKEHQNFLKIRLEYKNREISSKKLNSVYNREFIIKLLKNIEKVKENNSSLDEVI